MTRIHFSLAMARWHEWLVYLSVGLLTVSGLAWLYLDRFGKVQGLFGPEQNPALPWLLLVHGTIAYAFLIIASMLVPVHMRLGWNALRNRWSGLTVVGSGLFLAVSGLFLYYASAERLRGASSTAHWVVGVVLPLALLVHVVRGKSAQPAKMAR